MRKLFNLLLCSGILFGCKPAPSSLPPTKTLTNPSSTPAEAPRIATATPGIRIHEENYWLVYQIPDPEDNSRFSILVTTVNGEDSHQLDLPTIYEQVQISPTAVNTGRYAAIRVTDLELDPIDRVLSTEIWIISLPEGKVSRKIPLVGALAHNWLQQNPPTEQQGLSTTILGAPFVWSPDGRYLAFSGALDGETTDLYIYDVLEDQISQLTDGSRQAVIHSWSPDSQWIIHEATMFYLPQARVIYSSWAASVEGEVVRLGYGPFNNHPIIGWTAEDTFLTYTTRDQDASKELRMVNLKNGGTEFIFTQPFYEAAYDPDTATVLLNIQPVNYASAGSLPGIYTLGPETKVLTLLMPGGFSGLSWQSPNNKFSAVKENQELVMFSAQGPLPISLPYTENDQIRYSPNQHWMVISDQQHSDVYTLWGEHVLDIDEPGEILWLPDSSGFLFCSQPANERFSIYQYLLEKGWEREPLQEGISLPGCPVLRIP